MRLPTEWFAVGNVIDHFSCAAVSGTIVHGQGLESQGDNCARAGVGKPGGQLCMGRGWKARGTIVHGQGLESQGDNCARAGVGKPGGQLCAGRGWKARGPIVRGQGLESQLVIP